MKAHIVTNGIVSNTVEVDSLDALPGLIDGAAGGIGWAWDGQTLTPPPPAPAPIPSCCTMRQARLALLGAGLLTSVNDALAVMGGIDGEAARIEWEYATEVRRDSALVGGLAGALGLTEAQLDALFVAAVAL